MVRFSFIVTLLSSCLAALVLIFGFAGAKSAPQEASVAALACAMVIIPYVFTRCLQISEDREAQAETLKKIAELVQTRAQQPSVSAAPGVPVANG
jgi:hypothetical protein